MGEKHALDLADGALNELTDAPGRLVFHYNVEDVFLGFFTFDSDIRRRDANWRREGA